MPRVEAALPADEQSLLATLRAGDETTFRRLVLQHTPGLLRVARSYVADDATAQEVVQDTWLAFVEGLDRFEGRSSLQTWLYRVVANRARTRGRRDARTAPVLDLVMDWEDDEPGPVVPATRFHPAGHSWAGHWSVAPRAWARGPEAALEAAETLRVFEVAVDALSGRQRDVVRLRDVEGLATEEIAAVLDTTPGNVRVLLHRGRSAVRATLERYLQ